MGASTAGQDPLIAVLLFEGAEELDFAGPWEVLAMAISLFGGFKIQTVAEHRAPLTCAKRLVVLPDLTLAEVPTPAVLVVPGGRGVRSAWTRRPLLDWIASVAPGCRFVTSVCTGSALLVAAGPAQGRRVATHHLFADELESWGQARVERDQRFVVDGNLITSSGVSAGIDMSLWLVERLWGAPAATTVADQIEYPLVPHRT